MLHLEIHSKYSLLRPHLFEASMNAPNNTGQQLDYLLLVLEDVENIRTQV